MKNKNKKSLGKGLSALFGEDSKTEKVSSNSPCLLYTSDAADDLVCV